MGKLDDMRDDFWDLDRIMPKKTKRKVTASVTASNLFCKMDME